MDDATLLTYFWGKADPDVGPEPHPVVLHMLDVAAVALTLLDRGLPTLLRFDLLKLHPTQEITAAELAFIVACHDLGKLTPGFQSKVPELASRLTAIGADFPAAPEPDHARSTAVLGWRLLTAHGAETDAARLAIAVVAGHHGRMHAVDELVATNRFGGPFWSRAREAAVEALCSVLKPNLTRFAGWPSEAWLMALAGLTVAADWIGSDTNFFGYRPGVVATPDYFARARQRAEIAVERLGWRGPLLSQGLPTFNNLFPFEPRPMQRTVAEAVDQMSGAGLVLIESPTGEGKTEAAIYAAESMATRFGLVGFYFALPTQATSNQMFGRIRRYLEGRYPNHVVNLHLLHATRDVQESYAELRARSTELRARSIDGVGSDGALVAEHWFHGKKRGLLSPFAVGTVDQALMAALQSRHFFLRLLGLARKVLIIDEIHAYDAFMSRILDRLLSWLKVLGSGVILMSATLPASRRRELLTTWTGEPEESVQDVAYPRVMTATTSATSFQVPNDGRSTKTELRWFAADPSMVIPALLDALADGGCAAWIHNTVAEAQDAYEQLIAAGLAASEVVLFHARFPLEDKVARERAVIEMLAPSGTRPHRLIVVATQVLEQSLDIDVDLMVSALAPIDLLVQRAGRLRRHAVHDAQRPERLGGRVLWLTIGGTADDPSFGPSICVYDEHILLRTWWLLRQRDSWVLPDDADTLLNFVYAPVDAAPPSNLPVAVSERWRQTARALEKGLAEARLKGARQLIPAPAEPDTDGSFAFDVVSALDDPEEQPLKHADVLAKTRDIEMTVTVICLTEGPSLSPTDPTPIPFGGSDVPYSLVRRLLDRSLSIQHRGLVGSLVRQPVPPAWRRTALLRHCRPIVFDATGRAVIENVEVCLDPLLGLILPHRGALGSDEVS